jgi:hypothetical protein
MNIFPTQAILGALLIFGTNSAPAKGVPVPPAPQAALEMFNPTHRHHQINATCAGSQLEIRWKFETKNAAITKFNFNKKNAVYSEIVKINSWLQKIERDVFVWTECSNSGAIVSFIQANTAGTRHAKQIKMNWIND